MLKLYYLIMLFKFKQRDRWSYLTEAKVLNMPEKVEELVLGSLPEEEIPEEELRELEELYEKERREKRRQYQQMKP